VIKVKFGTGSGPAPRAKFHFYLDNVSPMWGEKPIFGPLSKNNTGMAALRAGLSVKKLQFRHALMANDTSKTAKIT